jgi:hypothetical protein
MLEYIELKDEKPTKLLTFTFDELYTDDNIQKVIQHLRYSSLNQVEIKCETKEYVFAVLYSYIADKMYRYSKIKVEEVNNEYIVILIP